jgi:hypothetical protein
MTTEAGLHYALRQAHAAENKLVAEMLDLASQHSTDHEVHHVARDLAAWSRNNLRRLSSSSPRNASARAAPDLALSPQVLTGL